MHLTLKHAIYSAILQTEATATFMFLPSRGRPMSTNPYSELLNAYPHLCCTLGTLPSTTLNYTTLPFWSAKKSCSLATHGAYKSLPSGIVQQGSA
eukprot:1154984-Pelagomonas_calceolata.AAC.2